MIISNRLLILGKIAVLIIKQVKVMFNIYRGLLLSAVALSLLMQSHFADAALLSKLFEGAPKRVEVTESSDKAADFKEAFKSEGMFAKSPNLISTNTKKIVIAGFQLEFATEQKGISPGGGSDAGLASTTDKTYTLKGITDSQLQAITDKSYANFVASLVKNGYEVLLPDTLINTEYKDKFAKINQPPVHHERGVAVDLLFGNGDNKEVDNASVIVSAKDTSPEVFSGMMMGWGSGPKAAESLHANIIQLRMKVNFARFEDKGTWLYSDIDGKPQNAIGIKGTNMQVYSPGSKIAIFPLSKTVLLPNRLAESVTPVSATAGRTTERATGGTLRALVGLATGDVAAIAGGTTGAAHSVMASDNFELTAPSNYEDLMIKDLSLALNMMTEAFPK
jgi:hypothetical protein